MKLDLTPEQTSAVVIAFLEAGTPAGAISRALDIDADPIVGMLSNLRIQKYGTDEKAEAMDHLIWVAYETALHEIEYGTPASKARFIQLVLARSVGIAGKSAPETSEKIRQALEEMRSDIAPVIQLEESIYDSGE